MMNATPYCVIPDLIGNPWPELSSMRKRPAMDSRFRGNDNRFGRGVSA
jgi:hypothetical protein